jgi:hypothetical protein
LTAELKARVVEMWEKLRAKKSVNKVRAAAAD